MSGELIRTIRHGSSKIIWADEQPEQDPPTTPSVPKICDNCLFNSQPVGATITVTGDGTECEQLDHVEVSGHND